MPTCTSVNLWAYAQPDCLTPPSYAFTRMPSITRNPLDCGFLAEAVGVLGGAGHLLQDYGGAWLPAIAVAESTAPAE